MHTALIGNPAAIKRTIETGGLNSPGIRHMADDWRDNGRLPSSVDVSKFKIGESLAATSGDVVFRRRTSS
jgi:polyhydroxyalkanoate synthase